MKKANERGIRNIISKHKGIILIEEKNKLPKACIKRSTLNVIQEDILKEYADIEISIITRFRVKSKISGTCFIDFLISEKN